LVVVVVAVDRPLLGWRVDCLGFLVLLMLMSVLLVR
jgi:hypothetical protein